ncbi:short chain dehydrogenase [Thelonectria olida]|uniref:Short chain dehydrogenase n=1 Tax=Thelonectria olida TaxID=1576542 RepID=A0A9P8WJ57_9HYPO|nr:short chain dehydrogenase [Thelonectria olida]
MALQGKTAIVTGSSGGLGQVIAKAFLDKGANVVICDVNPTRLSATADELKKEYQDRVFATEVDVSNEESVKKLIASTLETFQRLDVVVNNAGVMDHFDPAGSCDKALWDRVLAINLTGPFLVTKHAVQAMEKQGSGLIVNIGSNASHRGFSAGVAYTASKHGVVALTKNTAAYYGPRGVSCVALLLGAMETTNITEAFATGINQEGMALFRATEPGFVPGKTGLPTEDVAKYVLFLSEGDMGVNANGSCIVLNRNWPSA